MAGQPAPAPPPRGSGRARGLFVVVEGVEGAGKSTQVALLGEWLRDRGVPHLATREPGGTGVGEAIRGLVLNRTDLELSRECELLLILAARAAFVSEVVRPALERGEVVLSDRYELSSLAYQGWGRGLDPAVVARLSAFATGGLTPDLAFVLDVPVAVGAGRQQAQGKRADRFEGEGEAFLTRVREGYRALAAREAEVLLVDATGTPDAVQRELRSRLEAAFPETFGAPGR